MMIISFFIDRLQYTTRFTLRNSFEVVLIHSSIIQSQKYVKSNIISVASVTQRSNTARMGSTLAMAKVGLKYPVFGVGYGYMDMYVMHQLPDFTMASSEIQLWTNDILNSTFMQARYPIVNTLSAVIAQYGVPGLILFCAPLIYVAIFLSKNRKEFFNQMDVLCLVVAVIGQAACFFSNWFFYSYPISISLLYCYINAKKKEV